MKQQLKSFFAGLLLILVTAYHVSAQQGMNSHPSTIGIFRSYAADISPSLKSRLDSTIIVTADQFNTANRTFRVVVDDSSAVQKITLDVKKAKRATRKQRYLAYLVNLVVPVYIPAHKVKSSIRFPDGPSTHDNIRSVKSSTHILIGSIDKREDKMLQKYADRLLRELNEMTGHVRPEFTSSIQ